MAVGSSMFTMLSVDTALVYVSELAATFSHFSLKGHWFPPNRIDVCPVIAYVLMFNSLTPPPPALQAALTWVSTFT